MVVLSATLVGVAFPFQSLWRQQSELNATAAQISQLQREDQRLRQQASLTNSVSAEIDLARKLYQLVPNGESLIQVLPGAGSASSTAGDPGFAPLVNPTSTTPSVSTAGGPTTHRSSSFLGRLVRTLEFWR